MAQYLEYPSSELVRVCASSQNQAAWEEFIRRFQPLIAGAALRTARMWGESPPHLDDLVQEVYLKICENNCHLLRSFEPRHEDSIYGFLKVLAANVVHDHFKSTLAVKRGAGAGLLQIGDLEPTAKGDDGLAAVTQRLQLDRIDRILRQVTAGKGNAKDKEKDKDQEKKRAIFWLRHRQGFTASEIASLPLMGLTTEGVESVLLRLSLLIRSHLQGSQPHRDVNVLNRKNRSKKQGS